MGSAVGRADRRVEGQGVRRLPGQPDRRPDRGDLPAPAARCPPLDLRATGAPAAAGGAGHRPGLHPPPLRTGCAGARVWGYLAEDGTAVLSVAGCRRPRPRGPPSGCRLAAAVGRRVIRGRCPSCGRTCSCGCWTAATPATAARKSSPPCCPTRLNMIGPQLIDLLLIDLMAIGPLVNRPLANRPLVTGPLVNRPLVNRPPILGPLPTPIRSAAPRRCRSIRWIPEQRTRSRRSMPPRRPAWPIPQPSPSRPRSTRSVPTRSVPTRSVPTRAVVDQSAVGRSVSNPPPPR